jgi:hypothetical protein
MTIPFNIDSNFLNTHTESMLGDFSMNGAFARADPSPALRDQTYVTVEDNTAVLPNSMPLSGLASGFLSNTTLSGILNPRTFMGTANQIDIENGDGVAGNPTLSLSDALVLPGTLTSNGNVNFNGPALHITHEILLNASTAAIRATTGNKVVIESTDMNTPIDMTGNYIAVQSAICRRVSNGVYQLNNNITFGNQTQTYNIGGSSIFDISADGFRLGSGYRVNNITNSPSSVLDTDIPTMFAVQTAIGNAVMGANPFRGFWDASGGTYPTTGGTGSGGDIEAGNWWRISVAGTLGGEPVDIGDQIFAGVDNPGQTPANWTVVNPRVYSVFNRVGAVVATDNDYPFNYITGLPDTAPSGKLMRGDGSVWAESTASFADTYAQYDILYASGANTVTGLTKASNSVLTSNLASVPAWTELGNFQFLGGSLDGPKPFLITVANGLSVSYNSGTTPGTVTVELEAPVSIANGGTNTTAAIGAAGTMARSDGTKYTFTTATYPSTAGAAGNVLTSDGDNFISSPPAVASFGRMTVSNAYTGASFTISTTLKEVSTTQGLSVAWSLDADSSSDFSLPVDGQLTYIGTNPKTFRVDYSLTLNSGTRIQIALYKNGGLVKTSYGNGTSETGIRGCEITLENGDDLALWLAQASSGGGVAIYFGQLSLWSVD